MKARAVGDLAGAVALIALSVVAIYWVRDLFVAVAIFAGCGLIAGVVHPRPAAVVVPVAAALAAGLIDISSHRASWGPTKAGFMVLWLLASPPGVLCAIGAILLCRRDRSVTGRRPS